MWGKRGRRGGEILENEREDIPEKPGRILMEEHGDFFSTLNKENGI